MQKKPLEKDGSSLVIGADVAAVGAINSKKNMYQGPELSRDSSCISCNCSLHFSFAGATKATHPIGADPRWIWGNSGGFFHLQKGRMGVKGMWNKLGMVDGALGFNGTKHGLQFLPYLGAETQCDSHVPLVI